MDDLSRHRRAAPNLKAAIRRARIEDADRSEIVAELHGAEIARLEMLEAAIEPVLAQVPEDVDLFDVGLAPGERPRLFIDMIGFVEMGRDRRQYRFVQNMRHGRVVIAETESVEVMTEAIAAYIARRLVEREKALAADGPFVPADRPAHARAESAPQPGEGSSSGRLEPAEAQAFGRLRRGLRALVDTLGSLALIVILAVIVWFGWRLAFAWWTG